MTDTPWVLVTGGATRLGRETSLAFARAGWNVLCHYRHSAQAAQATAKEVQALGVRCVSLAADLAQVGAAAQLFAQCAAAVPEGPRCIVNNASLFEADHAAHADEAMLQRHFATNTVAPLLLAHALAAHVKKLPGQAPGLHCVVHVLDQKVHNLNPTIFHTP